MFNFIKKHAKTYMILGICLLIGSIGVSFAYYLATVSNDTEVVGQAGGGDLPLLTISKISTGANGKLVPITMNETTLTKAASASPKCVDNRGYTGCQIYSVTVQNNSTIAQSYNIELTRVSGVATPNVDAVTMGTSDNSVTNASSIKDNGLICKTNSVANGETTTPCYFMVLIKNLDTPQNNSGTFTGTVTITSTAGSKLKANFGRGEKLTTTISNLYNNASKSTVTNNSITYNYASSVSLMNDRLGNSNTGLNDGNIRYYGASPDNYVDIGDHYEEDSEKGNWEEDFGGEVPFTNSSECNTFFSYENLINVGECNNADECETIVQSFLQDTGFSSVADYCGVSKGTPRSLYRIIGLFKDVELSNGTKKNLIKVVRNEPIGLYSWDQSPKDINHGYGINEWSQADLMKLLNPGYESETVGGSLYWNSGSGSCYGYDESTNTYTSVPCNFTNKGLSTNAQNNIEAVKWNLGNLDYEQIYANQVYGAERGTNVIQNPSDGIQRTTLWTGRIALPYLSDYGYAVDFNSCDSTMIHYDNCISSNWMYNTMTLNVTNGSWLLTPTSSSDSGVWVVLHDYVFGNISSGITLYGNTLNDPLGVSPVFYLDSELIIESGTGKINDPFVVS